MELIKKERVSFCILKMFLKNIHFFILNLFFNISDYLLISKLNFLF
jgi:hypothetical protein